MSIILLDSNTLIDTMDQILKTILKLNNNVAAKM